MSKTVYRIVDLLERDLYLSGNVYASMPLARKALDDRLSEILGSSKFNRVFHESSERSGPETALVVQKMPYSYNVINHYEIRPMNLETE